MLSLKVRLVKLKELLNIKKLKMMKKIILISIFGILLFTCGKKGDPKYKATKNNILTFRI